MAKLSQLLLFDPDPSGLETLTYVFEKDGCTVGAISDAAKARAMILGTTSPLVLVALRDPEEVGIDLIQATTSNPRTRNIACLAIGPAKSRSAAMQAGAFGFLSSPLFVRDVLDACKLVAAAMVPGSRPSPDAEISIKLSEIGGVYCLIRALAACARSAAVEIQRGPRRGELRFLDGILSSVQLGALSGLSALHQLLLWEEADLRLKFRGVVRRGGQLSLKTEEVIEECDRFLRDFAHDVRELGTARTVYRQSDRAKQPTAALPSEVVPLLRLFDGRRDLAQIVDESPFRTFDTLRIARQFITAGAVVTDHPVTVRSPDVFTSGGPAALDAWLERKSPAGSASPSLPPLALVAAAPARPPGVSAERPSSPFVKVVASGAGAGASAPPPMAHGDAKERRPRSITEREHAAVKRPDAATRETTAMGHGGEPAAASRGSKPSVAVARGEIHVTPFTPKKSERPRKPDAPSVLVEIGALPTPHPIARVTPAPLTARTPPPSVVVAPMTPPPVIAKAPPAASVAVAPVTPLPLIAKAPPAPAAAADASTTPPPLTAAAAPPAKKSGVPASHRSRTPSNSFNALEADFFDREADLYKRDSVETFDDLDKRSAARSSATVPEGQRRRPARKT
jgi:CheY-like chemotaxis protein